MATGWGNIAGSDLRKLSKGKGVGRYANIESDWRKGLKFEETKELNQGSTISVEDLKELTGAKIPKSKRKQKSDKNIVSLDI